MNNDIKKKTRTFAVTESFFCNVTFFVGTFTHPMFLPSSAALAATINLAHYTCNEQGYNGNKNYYHHPIIEVVALDS